LILLKLTLDSKINFYKKIYLNTNDIKSKLLLTNQLNSPHGLCSL